MQARETEPCHVDRLMRDIERLATIHQGALDDIAFAKTNPVYQGQWDPDAPGSFTGRARSKRDASEHQIKWRLRQLPHAALARCTASPFGLVRRLTIAELGRRAKEGE
jgi:hypothetical protein